MPKWLEIDQDNLHRKFSALNLDFIRLSPDPQGLRKLAHAYRGTLLKSGYFSTVCLSSVKMVADSHKHAAQHNKHW